MNDSHKKIKNTIQKQSQNLKNKPAIENQFRKNNKFLKDPSYMNIF